MMPVLGPCTHKSGFVAWLNVCFAPKATSLLRGSENDAMCHKRRARAVVGATVSPSALAVVRLMNRKKSVGNQPLPELMLLLPHAAASLEIQLLVWAWTNDGAGLGLRTR